MKIVLGSGPVNAHIFLCGEGPGKVEAQTGIPFSGPSGRKLQEYMSYAGLPSLSQVYKTNISKVFIDGNPDPTPQQVADWTPVLLAELEEVKPRVILAIGRYAADWFLGPQSTDLEIMHGMPHYPIAPHLPECLVDEDSIIIPLLHPAGALWNYERGSLIRYGYEMAGEWIRRLDSGLTIHYRRDSHKGNEDYNDVTGKQIASILRQESEFGSVIGPRTCIGLDTEGTPDKPWSIQISLCVGSGYLLRCSHPDFRIGIDAISKFLHSSRPTIALHDASTPKCSCYDVVMCRQMGLELQGLSWFNTMYWAYLRRLEPQGNKALCDRWQAMDMEDYQATIGGLSKDQQIDYLNNALSLSVNWPKPDKIYTKENDGTVSVTQPKAIRSSIERILSDILDSKETKNGPTDPAERWQGLKESNPQQTAEIESKLGTMPEASLEDVPLEKATVYACKDSDGTLRNALTFMELAQ
jgi:uracil-DNA glycosylase